MKHMKKILALSLVIVSVLAIAATALATTTGKYNTAAVHLRSSMGGTSLGLVNKGTTCNILNNKTDSSGQKWYQVTITSHTTNGNKDLYNYTGWSMQKYIDVTGGSTPSNTPQNASEAFGPAGVYLRLGSSGNYVRNLQKALNHIGGIYCPLDEDGDFGEATLGAVEVFQEVWLGENDADGVVGPKTKNKLWERAGEYLKQFGIK